MILMADTIIYYYYLNNNDKWLWLLLTGWIGHNTMTSSSKRYKMFSLAKKASYNYR